jgi:transposase
MFGTRPVCLQYIVLDESCSLLMLECAKFPDMPGRQFVGNAVEEGQRRADKRGVLREHGSLNPHPETVGDPGFADSEFFDPDDLVQVKYEMLRRVRVDKQPVSHAAAEFGFSRPSFYQARIGFERRGIAGLFPKKRGPKGPSKLSAEIVDFLVETQQADDGVKVAQLVSKVHERFGVSVHRRSIERALARQEKKRR